MDRCVQTDIDRLTDSQTDRPKQTDRQRHYQDWQTDRNSDRLQTDSDRRIETDRQTDIPIYWQTEIHQNRHQG